ncbi:MAG: cytidine deaminase [Candidatus Paceibacterota bacterium]|jgi:cytidine deaminase
MVDELSYLKDGLALAVAKKTVVGVGSRTSTVAYSKSGRKYRGANIDSDTNLLNISSEQSALLLAVAHSDYLVEEVVTLVEKDEGFIVNPFTVKTMIDFCVRTGGEIKYRVVNIDGKEIFSVPKVTEIIPFYKPHQNILEKVKGAVPSESKAPFQTSIPVPDQLKKYAVEGLGKCFHTYNNASAYSTAVLTEDSVIYYSGQYSSFEKRGGIHSEMAAPILALMDGKTKIVALGLVSTKFTDTPCEICGCCRQFLAEISSKYDLSINLYCFAKDTDEFKQYTLDELLPNQWSSKKW